LCYNLSFTVKLADKERKRRKQEVNVNNSRKHLT